MALVINNRVRELTSTTGTGAVTLGGAVGGFQTFAAGIGNDNTTYYAISINSENEWEVGLGTLNADSSTLTRTSVLESSNGDAAVDFSAGSKEIFCTLPAEKAVYLDADGDPVGVDADSSRLQVQTLQDEAFDTFTNYQAFAVPTSATAISADSPNGTGAEIGDSKEIIIQVDSANTGYVMVGHSAATCVANATVTNRKGLKLVGGETLVIAVGDFTKVFLAASASSQNVYVAYFK